MDYESRLMTFEEMLVEFFDKGVENWHGMLVPQPDDRGLISEHELKENLKNTWWEVSWTFGMPQCRYLADSLRDALRLRPQISLAGSSSSEMYWETVLSELEEEEQEDVYAGYFD